jgi:hypothetical protein
VLVLVLRLRLLPGGGRVLLPACLARTLTRKTRGAVQVGVDCIVGNPSNRPHWSRPWPLLHCQFNVKDPDGEVLGLEHRVIVEVLSNLHGIHNALVPKVTTGCEGIVAWGLQPDGLSKLDFFIVVCLLNHGGQLCLMAHDAMRRERGLRADDCLLGI